jgi:hypothetical protein
MLVDVLGRGLRALARPGHERSLCARDSPCPAIRGIETAPESTWYRSKASSQFRLPGTQERWRPAEPRHRDDVDSLDRYQRA